MRLARFGSPPSGCRSSMRCIQRRCAIPPIDAPAEFAERSWARERSARRTRAQSPAGTGPRHRAAPCRIRSAWPVAGVDAALAQAGSRRRRHGGRVQPATLAVEWCDRDAARAHSSLHREAAAAGDRARHDPGFHALPVSLAARFAGRAAAGPGCARRDRRPIAGLRGTRCRVGIRTVAGAARKLRVHVARRSVFVGPRGVDASCAARARRRCRACRT